MGEAVKTGVACSAQQCTQTLQSGTRLVVKKLPLIHVCPLQTLLLFLEQASHEDL